MPEDSNLPEKIEPKDEIVSLVEVDDPILKDMISAYDDNEFLKNIKMTKETVAKMIKYAKKVSLGSYAYLTLICLGEKGCCYSKTCPVIKSPPIGHECMFERIMAESIRRNYMESLSVDPENSTEVSQINDIVEADVLNARVNAILAKEGLTIENAVGYDQDSGEVISRTEEHVVMNIKDRVQNRKDKLLKNFLATREKKMQALNGAKGSEDTTSYLSKLRDKYNREMIKNFAVEGKVVEKKPEEKKKLENKNVMDQKLW